MRIVTAHRTPVHETFDKLVADAALGHISAAFLTPRWHAGGAIQLDDFLVALAA
jgi:hypothetical protein